MSNWEKGRGDDRGLMVMETICSDLMLKCRSLVLVKGAQVKQNICWRDG